jgi:hypothetical protein
MSRPLSGVGQVLHSSKCEMKGNADLEYCSQRRLQYVGFFGFHKEKKKV